MEELFEIKRCMLVNVYSVDILISDIKRILALNPEASCLLFISFHSDILKIFGKITILKTLEDRK